MEENKKKTNEKINKHQENNNSKSIITPRKSLSLPQKLNLQIEQEKLLHKKQTQINEFTKLNYDPFKIDLINFYRNKLKDDKFIKKGSILPYINNNSRRSSKELMKLNEENNESYSSRRQSARKSNSILLSSSCLSSPRSPFKNNNFVNFSIILHPIDEISVFIDKIPKRESVNIQTHKKINEYILLKEIKE